MIPLNIPYIIACSILNAHPNIPPVISAIPAYNNLLFQFFAKNPMNIAISATILGNSV